MPRTRLFQRTSQPIFRPHRHSPAPPNAATTHHHSPRHITTPTPQVNPRRQFLIPERDVLPHTRVPALAVHDVQIHKIGVRKRFLEPFVLYGNLSPPSVADVLGGKCTPGGEERRHLRGIAHDVSYKNKLAVGNVSKILMRRYLRMFRVADRLLKFKGRV